DVPVDVTEVVAHPVGAIVAELDAVAAPQAAALALHPAAEDPSREQREALELRQKLGREERLAGDRHGARLLALVERLEVVADLIVKVARHLLARDRVLHLLAVLTDDAEVLQARRHAAAAAGQVRVVAVLAAGPRLALDADVERTGAQALGRFALGRAAPALARHQPLALAEVLVLGPHAVAARAVLATSAALGFATAAQALARALRLVHRPHLVERLLH